MLILEKVMSPVKPSFEDLREHLSENGFEISQRTLQRQLEQMRHEFGIEIRYDRSHNHYELLPDDGMNSGTLSRFLELLGTAELFAEGLRDNREMMNYLMFENEGNFRGIEHLRILLAAIRSRKRVEFLHENYESGTKRKYLLQPYLMREYQGRWYVIGMVGNTDEFRTFGIDRIHQLEVKKDVFRRRKDVDPRDFFSDVIGLVYSESEVEEVTVKVDLVQMKYLKSLPLHTSQQFAEVYKDYAVMKLRIRPNFEFRQKMLALGERATVLKPEWLRKEMREVIKKMSTQYERL